MTVLRRDVMTERDVERTRAVRPRTRAQVESRRGRGGDFSRPARRRFMFHLQNCASVPLYAVLSYPDPAPDSGPALSLHVDLFRRWVVGKGCGIVWRVEFGRCGRPHVHAFLTGEIEPEAVRGRWARIAGGEESPALVDCRPVRDREAAEWYTLKPERHFSNRVPEGFSDMGRWWGHAGPGSKPVPLAVIEGTEANAAPVVRLARKVQAERIERKGKVRRRARKDNGVTSFRLYGAGGEAMAEGLTRYADSLGLGPSKPITGEGEKGFLAAGETAGDGE